MKVFSVITKILIWFIWVQLFGALFMYHRYIWDGNPRHTEFDVFLVSMFMIPLLVSCGIRWWLLPRVRNIFLIFIAFIVGMSSSLTMDFFGLFLFSGYYYLFFGTSILLVVQYIPIFLHIRRTEQVDGDNS